jgi:enoyl-[acyl-carrier protein] reductase I
MKLTKRAAGVAAPETDILRLPPANGSAARLASTAASVESRAAVVEAPASVGRPHVARRLTRPTDDCDREGLLKGKKALVFGVANDHSIAWGIAKALYDQGAEVGFSSMASLIKRRVRPLAASIGSHFVEACDVRDDDEIRRVFEHWHAREGNLDILVHAVAYAEKEDLAGNFSATSRDGFHTAFDISVYSLIAMAREARAYMPPGSSIMTMTYYGAEKVVPHYNVMGVAKAALEASTRYLAADLGPSGIRVNAISAGPVRTLSAHGIAGFRTMYGAFAEVTPLRSHITIEDVAGTAVYLASPLSGKTTGEVIYVDGGFNILGLPVVEE